MLPADHPGPKAFKICADRQGTWPGAVKEAMRRVARKAGGELPDIAPEDEEDVDSSEARKKAVQRYKKSIVRPLLQRYDDLWFLENAAKAVASSLPLNHIMARGAPAVHGEAAIGAASKARDWNCYRLWSLVRLTGAIPLAAWEWRRR